MRASAATLLLAASMVYTCPALATEMCSQLPDALQTTTVNHPCNTGDRLANVAG